MAELYDPALPSLEIAMLLYPDLTLLDLAGPQAALAFHGRTHLVWKTREPVRTDSGIALLPTATFDECPRQLDVLFVPGGMGTNAILQDSETLAFLGEAALHARFITSVCSGSLILAAAGLLNGYRAATHWAAYEALEALGVQAERSRIVVDRNRISGGGVTAGLDFGLTLLAQLRGETTAKVTQLMMEYDPHPPFAAGTPDTAGPQITKLAMDVLEKIAGDGLLIASNLESKRTT